MKSRSALSLLLFLLTGLTAATSSAGISARLVYLRSGSAEACPDQAALRKAVAGRLGYDPFLAAALHTIVAEVSGNGGELRARARLIDDGGIVLGSRELVGKGSDCAELLNSLALAISLTLDPITPASVPESAIPDKLTPPAEGADESAASEPEKLAAAPDTKQAPARHGAAIAPVDSYTGSSLSVRAGILGTLGWVPALSPAADLGLLLRYRDWSLGLDAVAVVRQSEDSLDGSRATVSVAYAALSPCFWLHTVGLCPLTTLGRYSAQSSGVNAPRSGSHLHASAGVRGQVMLPLGARWFVGLQADGVRNLTRPEFLISGQEVYRPSAWATNLGIFAAWQLL